MRGFESDINFGVKKISWLIKSYSR